MRVSFAVQEMRITANIRIRTNRFIIVVLRGDYSTGRSKLKDQSRSFWVVCDVLLMIWKKVMPGFKGKGVPSAEKIESGLFCEVRSQVAS